VAPFKEYEDYDALGLAALIRRREVRAEEVLEAAIERIEARNPRLNAVVHKTYEEVPRAARARVSNGPLAGVPYLLKDLYVLLAGAPTTNGSRLFADFVADHDSTITERLRAAGLVILGKTNTPEFGLNMSTEPALFGPTRNPWNMARSAGGSSGGSAAAVAAGVLPAAHATDGGGSIRIPAAHCGLFGLKPTRARNPAGPDVGEGWSGLSVGHAVTRSVRDSAALLDATHGPAPGDPYHAPPPARTFLAEVGAEPGRLRIALMTGGRLGEPVDPECVRAAEEAAKLCQELGHAVEEGAPEYDAEAMRSAVRVIIAANVRNTLNLRGAVRGRPAEEREVEPVSWRFALEGGRIAAADYARAIQILHTTGRRLAAFFERYDLVLSPTLAQPPLPLGTTSMATDDHDRYFTDLFDRLPFTPLFNVSGHPAVSVPLGWTADGLPVGVQFGARFGDEATLLRIASQLERAKPWAGRRPP